MSQLQLPQFRVTVNSRCGRACFYCRPSGEAVATKAGIALTSDDVIRITAGLARLGVSDVKLTGGDPALWWPLVETVRRLKEMDGIKHVEVISRHPRIGELVGPLSNARADVINISLDTLQRDKHRWITGIDDLPDLLAAIRKAVATGISCKINTVVMRGINDDEIDSLISFCQHENVRTLKFLDVIDDLDQGTEAFVRRLRSGNARSHARSLKDLYLPLGPLAKRLSGYAAGRKTISQGGLGHPMTTLVMGSGLTILIKDHRLGAWYGSVCSACKHYPCHDALMALRLTADLRLQFCLLKQDVTVDLRPALAAGQDELLRTLDRALNIYRSANFRVESPNADSPLIEIA